MCVNKTSLINPNKKYLIYSVIRLCCVKQHCISKAYLSVKNGLQGHHYMHFATSESHVTTTIKTGLFPLLQQHSTNQRYFISSLNEKWLRHQLDVSQHIIRLHSLRLHIQNPIHTSFIDAFSSTSMVCFSFGVFTVRLIFLLVS